MPMAPEAAQIVEIYLDGVAPTIDTIMLLPQGKSLRVWDPRRDQTALVFRDSEGRLRIQTGDLKESPEEYDIETKDALEDALEQWRRAKAGEAKQDREAIEFGAF